MRIPSILFAIMACLILSGCIQTDTVIHVRPDGSGTIEETVQLSNALIESMQNLGKEMSESVVGEKPEADAGPASDAKNDVKDKPAQTDPLQGMMKDAESHAAKYGPNVKFVSAAPVKGETMSGYKAIYSFKDINTLRINQNPESKTAAPSGDKDQAPKKEEIIRFKLVKGPVSKLTMTMPAMDKKPDEAKKDDAAKKPTPDPAAAEMMKAFFKDMSVKLAIVIDGEIVETNATYRDKSQLTLLDMNFGKIIENQKIFDNLNAVQPKTIEEMKGLVKEIPGLKIEMNNPVEVAFR